LRLAAWLAVCAVSCKMSALAALEPDDAPRGVRQWCEEVGDKAKAVRVQALAQLVAWLRRDPEGARAELGASLETTAHNVKGVVAGNKAKGDEFVLACALAGLLGVCCEPEQQGLVLAELVPALLACCAAGKARDGQTDAALSALAALVFLLNEEDELLARVVALLEQHIAGHVPDETRCAALRAWGVLAGLRARSELAACSAAAAALLLPLLAHPSLDVRVEAAENLAMLVDVGRQGAEVDTAHLPAARPGAVVEGFEVGAPSGGAAAADDDDEWAAGLVDTLEHCSETSDTSHSKKDLKEQRLRLRRALASVRDGEPPADKVTLDKTPIPLEGWDDVMRLAMAREVLQGGLTAHLRHNPVLQGMFDIAGRGLEGKIAGHHIVNVDEKVFRPRGQHSAQRISRQRDRAKRDAFKSSFLAAD
jgi:hypothetical protein